MEAYVTAWATLVLAAIPCLPAFVLFVCSFAYAKWQRDPLRSWIIPLRISLILFTFWSVFYPVAVLMVAIFYTDGMMNGLRILGAISDLGLMIPQSLILVMFVQIYLAMHQVAKQTPSPHANIHRIAAYILASVTMLMLIASFGITMSYVVADTPYHYDRNVIWANLGLRIASSVVFLLASIFNFVLAIRARSQARGNQNMRSISKFFTIAAGLWLVANMFSVAVNPVIAFTMVGLWIEVLYLLAFAWPTFVILVLIYAMANRKHDGLWSNSSPGVAYNQVQNPAIQSYTPHALQQQGQWSYQSPDPNQYQNQYQTEYQSQYQSQEPDQSRPQKAYGQ